MRYPVNLRPLIHSALGCSPQAGGLASGSERLCWECRGWECRGTSVRNRCFPGFQPYVSAPRSSSALRWCWRSRPSALAWPISALTSVSEASLPTGTASPEADLARNIDRELISYRSAVKYYVVDRQGRRRQGGAGGRGQPEGRHRQGAERHQQAGADRGDQAPRHRVQEFCLHFCRHPQGQARKRARSRQNQLSRDANMLRYKLEDIASQCRRVRTSGRVRRQAGLGPVSDDGRARQHLCHQFRPGGR